MFAVYIILAVISFFFFAVVGACLWEKRLVSPYILPPAGNEYPPSKIAHQSNNALQELGYRYAGLRYDGKGDMYRVRYDFWLAPDNLTIAMVSSGTVAKLIVNSIRLISGKPDGRMLSTTDTIGDQDISGADEQQTWTDLPISVLVQKHDKRLESSPVEPFPDDAIAGMIALYRRKIEALVARGRAYYLDSEHTSWRYTLKGALFFYFVGTWVRPFQRDLRPLGIIRE